MKPKRRTKSTALSPAAQKVKKNEKDATKSIKSLCSRARASLEEGDLQQAHDFASRACALLPCDSKNVHPIELLGEINIEMSELETARECFLEAVRRREGVPAESFEPGEEGKFLWLGQLSSDEEAEKWYTIGVKSLLRVREIMNEEDKQKHLDEKICEVYCSLIELYLTDLCMNENAEQSAEQCACLALEYNSDSAVALQLLASIRLSQTRTEEAINLLNQALSKWLGIPEASTPSYQERINLVKLLLEVEMYSKALEVLETLQREDEEHVELWYLYTCAYYHESEESKEENWKNAIECAEMCLKLMDRMEWDDDELHVSCQEMLTKIQESGIVVDKEPEADEPESDGAEDEWKDSDEDVEMEDTA